MLGTAELKNLDEAALDQALMQRGVRFVLDDPGRYARLSLSRIPIYFMFWATDESGSLSNILRVSSAGIALPCIVIGLLCWIFTTRRERAVTDDGCRLNRQNNPQSTAR